MYGIDDGDVTPDPTDIIPERKTLSNIVSEWEYEVPVHKQPRRRAPCPTCLGLGQVMCDGRWWDCLHDGLARGGAMP